VLGGTPNVRKFMARNGTVKFGSEICGRRATKLLQIDHRTTQEAVEKGTFVHAISVQVGVSFHRFA
jgi:hypothetical protein